LLKVGPSTRQQTAACAQPAGRVYAATSGTQSAIANNFHTVSAYNVACFQASQHP
jgi:hypothetical protein